MAYRCNHIQEGQWQRLWPRHQEQAGFYASARCRRVETCLLCWSQSHVHVRSRTSRSCQHRTICTMHGHIGLTAVCSKSFQITNFLQSRAHTQGEAHDCHTAEIGCCILPTSSLLMKLALSETIQERQKTRSQQRNSTLTCGDLAAGASHHRVWSCGRAAMTDVSP